MNTKIVILVILAKKSIDADYSALTTETESSQKAPKFNVGNH